MKKALITGANRGIGLAMAQVLSERGYELYAVVRSSSEALEAVAATVVTECDLTKPACIETAINALCAHRFDLVIQNAGIMTPSSVDHPDPEGILQMFQTNAVAPLCFSIALKPLMATPSKIGLITSRMGSIQDNTSGGSYGYRMSKAALNAAGVSLARDFADAGISVAILHPGYVKTDMTEQSGDIEPKEAANRLIDRLENDLTPSTSGQFWHSNGTLLPF